MTPDKSQSDIVGRVAKKVRVEGASPFNPYFYVPKYHSSDALPAPEIFSDALFIQFKVQLYDASNVGSNVGSKRSGQYGANAGANVGGAGCRLYDASNSPILEANIRQ